MHHTKSANMDVGGSELLSEYFQAGGSLKEIVGEHLDESSLNLCF